MRWSRRNPAATAAIETADIAEELRLKELKSHHNSYLKKNGIIAELVDFLSGRVFRNVFCRHYLGEDIKAFGKSVLAIENNLERTLITF